MYRYPASHLSLLSQTSESGRCLLCVPSGWELYISGEFFEIHKELMKKGWDKLTIDEISDEEILSAIDKCDIVLFWEAYEFIERNAVVLCVKNKHKTATPKRIFFCDDVHYFTSHRQEQRQRAFEWADILLATYPHRLSQWFPMVSIEKIIWMPHSAASYFFDGKKPSVASNRVLLSGSKTWPYPFRQFCAAKIDNSICDVLDHPGYPGYPGDRSNKSRTDSSEILRVGRERYAEILRKYPAMLVCGSIFGYLVAKVFEGMAAGCLIICERYSLGDQLSALGFQDGKHFISTDLPTVIEDTNKFRNNYLSDISHWKEVTQAASSKVLKEHTTIVRASQIHSLCMEILKNERN